MTSPITEEVDRVEKSLGVASDSLALLAVLPSNEPACRSAVYSLDKRSKQPVADLVEHIFHLEQAHVYKKPMPGDGDGVSAAGDIAAELDIERRLAHAYRDLEAAVGVDVEARSVLEALFPPTPGCKALSGTLVAVARFFRRRAFESRQLSLSAAAVESRARMATAERDVALLKDELSRKRKAQGKEATSVQAKIDGVKAELAELYGGANDQYNRVQADVRAHVDSLASRHGAHSAELRDHAARLRVEHAALGAASKEAEAALRKRVARAGLEAESCVREYDEALAARHAEAEALRRETAAHAAAEAEFAAYYRVVRGQQTCGRTRACAGLPLCCVTGGSLGGSASAPLPQQGCSCTDTAAANRVSGVGRLALLSQECPGGHSAPLVSHPSRHL